MKRGKAASVRRPRKSASQARGAGARAPASARERKVRRVPEAGGVPSRVDVRIVGRWDPAEILALYEEAGWPHGKGEAATALVARKIEGSWAFAVAADASTGRAVGAGRIISDGASDGYVQELVVTKAARGQGIGRRLLEALLGEAESRGLLWVGAVGEPGTEGFYASTRMRLKDGYALHLWER